MTFAPVKASKTQEDENKGSKMPQIFILKKYRQIPSERFWMDALSFGIVQQATIYLFTLYRVSTPGCRLELLPALTTVRQSELSSRADTRDQELPGGCGQ